MCNTKTEAILGYIHVYLVTHNMSRMLIEDANPSKTEAMHNITKQEIHTPQMS